MRKTKRKNGNKKTAKEKNNRLFLCFVNDSINKIQYGQWFQRITINCLTKIIFQFISQITNQKQDALFFKPVIIHKQKENVNKIFEIFFLYRKNYF